jgi:hypothetical protein
VQSRRARRTADEEPCRRDGVSWPGVAWMDDVGDDAKVVGRQVEGCRCLGALGHHFSSAGSSAVSSMGSTAPANTCHLTETFAARC